METIFTWQMILICLNIPLYNVHSSTLHSAIKQLDTVKAYFSNLAVNIHIYDAADCTYASLAVCMQRWLNFNFKIILFEHYSYFNERNTDWIVFLTSRLFEMNLLQVKR